MSDCIAVVEKEKMKKEMEAEIRAQLALNQEAMQSWDEKVSLCCHILKTNCFSLNNKTNLVLECFFFNVHSQKRAICSKFATGLLLFSHQADIRMIFHIACSSLMITSLVQIVNRLDAC